MATPSRRARTPFGAPVPSRTLVVPPHKDSAWPIYLMVGLLLVGLAATAFMVMVIFSPSLGGL